MQDWVASVNVGEAVKRGVYLISPEPTRMLCLGPPADEIFQLLVNQQRWSYSGLAWM